MLVLTRKRGEKICIGNGITVAVLDIRGKSLKLGINAPRSVRILRSEIQPFAVSAAAPPSCGPTIETATIANGV